MLNTITPFSIQAQYKDCYLNITEDALGNQLPISIQIPLLLEGDCHSLQSHDHFPLGLIGGSRHKI